MHEMPIVAAARESSGGAFVADSQSTPCSVDRQRRRLGWTQNSPCSARIVVSRRNGQRSPPKAQIRIRIGTSRNHNGR
jgi:hypothetical protein